MLFKIKETVTQWKFIFRRVDLPLNLIDAAECSMFEPVVRKLIHCGLETRQEHQLYISLLTSVITLHSSYEFIHRENDEVLLPVVLEGLVCRYAMLRDGSRQVTAIYVPGDMCEVLNIFENRTRHFLMAITPCRIAVVSNGSLTRAIKDNFCLALAVWHEAMHQGAISEQWLVRVGRQSARSSLSHLLCEIVFRLRLYSNADTPPAFELPLTQEILADACGCTAIHVNRVMRSLRDEGLVEVQHGRIGISDLDRLSAIGDFCSDYLNVPRARKP